MVNNNYHKYKFQEKLKSSIKYNTNKFYRGQLNITSIELSNLLIGKIVTISTSGNKRKKISVSIFCPDFMEDSGNPYITYKNSSYRVILTVEQYNFLIENGTMNYNICHFFTDGDLFLKINLVTDKKKLKVYEDR